MSSENKLDGGKKNWQVSSNVLARAKVVSGCLLWALSTSIKGWLCCHSKCAICNKQADLRIVDSTWQCEMRFHHPAAVFYIGEAEPLLLPRLCSQRNMNGFIRSEAVTGKLFEENSQMETESFIYWWCLLLLEGLTWKGKRHWFNEVSACCWLQSHICHTEQMIICFVSHVFYFNSCSNGSRSRYCRWRLFCCVQFLFFI